MFGNRVCQTCLRKPCRNVHYSWRKGQHTALIFMRFEDVFVFMYSFICFFSFPVCACVCARACVRACLCSGLLTKMRRPAALTSSAARTTTASRTTGAVTARTTAETTQTSRTAVSSPFCARARPLRSHHHRHRHPIYISLH